MSNDSGSYKAREAEAHEAVKVFVFDQFRQWKEAREGQGNRVAADGVQPLPRSPDVYREFDELPEDTHTFLYNLAHQSRLQTLRDLSDQEFSALVVAAADGRELDGNLKEKVAESLHEGWLQTRQDMGLSGHWGDKPWGELPETAKDNDRVLVIPLGLQMVGYMQSDDPHHHALLEMVGKAHLTLDTARERIDNPIRQAPISEEMISDWSDKVRGEVQLEQQGTSSAPRPGSM